MTEFLFRENSYLKATPATVAAVRDDGSVVLDRTVFYAASGGQPGDTGALLLEDGRRIAVVDTVHPDGDKTVIAHVPAPDTGPPAPGDRVTAEIDWPRRHRLMRMHTALHLLSVVLPFPVTGGSVGEDRGRLDFDMPEAPGDLPALETRINDLVIADHAVTAEWISDEELAAHPELVKTMAVKPPTGQGRVRLIRIGTGERTVDLQPCGGTHVESTAEIGAVRFGKIEKKGRQNRRVSLAFARPAP